MAHFVERFKGDRKFLCISNGDHDEESETSLPIYKSLLRAQHELVNTVTPADFQENMSLPARPSAYGTRGHTLISTLPTQPMQDEIFPLLGRRIISGDTRWGCRVIQIPGESSYMAGYWEWTEDVLSRFGTILKNCSIDDAVYASLYSYVREPSILRAFLEAWCPSTNTLHTMFGEFSISLWDLHRLSGLPVLGSIYDEAVPSFDNLHALDAQGVRVIPRACHFLLVVYHRLKIQYGGKGVTSQQWIEFWCKRSHVYKMPQKRRRESKNPPKFTGNPSGKIDPKPLVWTVEEAKIFESLGIVHEGRKQSTYVAAFLSCWLCNFVLPESEDRFIRPETFEVSSLMARGEVFSLAPPVLASIYRGLNMISTSLKPGYSGSVFPGHYLYGWLAHYFRTHHEVEPCPRGPRMVLYSGAQRAKFFKDDEARRLIHDGRSINLGCITRFFDKGVCLHDDGAMDKVNFSYFTSLRTACFPLRSGALFVLQPYTPYRFSKQFGFCQGLPGTLTLDAKHVSYKEALKRWRMILFEGSQSRVNLFPPPRSKWRDFNSLAFEKWWSKVDVKDLLAKARVLNSAIEPDPTKKLSKNHGKKGATCISPYHPITEGSGETPTIIQSPGNQAGPSQTKQIIAEGVDSGDGESDTNFKHRRRGDVDKDKAATTNVRTPNRADVDLFAEIPEFSDNPSKLILDGEFNLEKEVPNLIGDPLLEVVVGRSNPRKGKELKKFEHLVDEGKMESSHPKNKTMALSTSTSQPSVQSPHSLEVVTRQNLEHQQRTLGTLVNVHPNMSVPAPSVITIMPETPVKGILHAGLKMATSSLLKTVKEAAFADVEKIGQEAALVYKCIKHFKGDPSRLQDKIESYVAIVKAFRFLEEATKDRLRHEDLGKEITEEREGLEKNSHVLADAEATCLTIAEKMSNIGKVIAQLEDTLEKAHQAYRQLVSDMENPERSCKAARDQIEIRGSKIAKLEATPQLSAEDVAVLEEKRRLVLELQSSLDPDAWMDLVL